MRSAPKGARGCTGIRLCRLGAVEPHGPHPGDARYPVR
ncbi:hypothetical protein SGLAM104S_00329 [Streptomyces glaucescens]